MLPQMYLLEYFEATFDFSHSEFTAKFNISQIFYCCQILLQSSAVNCIIPDNLTPLGVTHILLSMVQPKLQEGMIS